ncbi:MAG: DUF6785 family protein [Armatimonadota bacterium]
MKITEKIAAPLSSSTPQPQVTPEAAAAARGVSWRAIIAGLVLIWPNAWWIYMMEIIRYSGHPTTISIFFNSILILLALIAINGLLRRFAPRFMFSQAELLTVYIMLNISSALVSHDFIQVLVPGMTHPFFFANSPNQWGKLVVPYMKPWLSVRNKHTLESFYSGNDSFLAMYNLKYWVVPILCWSAFIIVMVLSMLCLVILLRKQWTERERLAYPLVQLPMDMTAPGAPLFRNRLMWIGFGLAATIDFWNGWAFLYPQLPLIPTKSIDLTSSFSAKPWNAIGWFPMCFYPFAIGLGILLPLDLSFSCWFFFIIWKLQFVISSAQGFDAPGVPFVQEQSFGAYLGIASFALWSSRKHLGLLLRGAVNWKLDLEDKQEPISYRLAGFGFVAGTIFLIVFAYTAGMRPWVAITFFAIYWMLALAITRMRAELGPPAHDLHDAGPDRMITMIAGTGALGAHPGTDPTGSATLTALSQFRWFNRAYRSFPMAFELEGFKMAERSHMNYKRLGMAMALATVVGTFASFWAVLTLTYKYGAAARMAPPGVPLIFGGEPYGRLDGWLKTVQDPAMRIHTVIAIVAGFVLTIGLNACRMRMGWFPLHPVGYAVSSSWSMNLLWMSLLLAWGIKGLMLRYGGLKLYRQSLPFFMGLILGECVAGGGWLLVGVLLGIRTYAFWPWP